MLYLPRLSYSPWSLNLATCGTNDDIPGHCKSFNVDLVTPSTSFPPINSTIGFSTTSASTLMLLPKLVTKPPAILNGLGNILNLKLFLGKVALAL